MKALIETAELLPDIAADHQKRSGRLFHGAWLIQDRDPDSDNGGSRDSTAISG